MIPKTIHTVESDGGIYLQDYLKIHFREVLTTSTSIKKSIKNELIHVNGKRAYTGTIVAIGDQITQFEHQATPPKSFDLELEIVFEDDHLAVINKPAGIAVSGNKYRTIQNALIGKLKPSAIDDALPWPQPVHRLDESTTGLLIIAKTKNAQLTLSKQFENHAIAKKYNAITVGMLPHSKGNIDTPIDNKDAHTHYEVIQTYPSAKYGAISFVNLLPTTGRKHQLRIHLATLNCPIMGDQLHGLHQNNYFQKGLFLCAYSLTFIHPASQLIQNIEIKLPRKFQKYLTQLQQRIKSPTDN